MAIFGIFHKYEITGDYCDDSIYEEELIGVTSSMSKAIEYVNKYQLIDSSKLLGEGEVEAKEGIIYDNTFTDIHMGILVIRELNEIDINVRPYNDWMLSSALEVNKDEKMNEKIKNIM